MELRSQHEQSSVDRENPWERASDEQLLDEMGGMFRDFGYFVGDELGGVSLGYGKMTAIDGLRHLLTLPVELAANQNASGIVLEFARRITERYAPADPTGGSIHG